MTNSIIFTRLCVLLARVASSAPHGTQKIGTRSRRTATRVARHSVIVVVVIFVIHRPQCDKGDATGNGRETRRSHLRFRSVRVRGGRLSQTVRVRRVFQTNVS